MKNWIKKNKEAEAQAKAGSPARFAHAKTRHRTKFQGEFEERLDYHLRRRLIEEAIVQQIPKKN